MAKPKIVTIADIHLKNDDPYGIVDDRGVNDFLLLRYSATQQAIAKARKLKAHLVIAGDFLDSKIVDSHTLYYSSKLIEEMSSLPFVVMLEGNHGYDDKRGTFSVISHWKHLASSNVRIVTYPKIERKDHIAYHCIPALSDVDITFPKIVQKLAAKKKKGDTNVLVLHAPISGAKFESGKENTGGIVAEHIRNARKKYDFVVCGDLHRYQPLYDNVWYTGSIIQSSLRDKGQSRGFQVINPKQGNFMFIESNGPKFLELNWEPGKTISKILSKPHLYQKQLRNAVVVVRLIGYSNDIDAIDREEIKDKLRKNGAMRVFVEPRKLDAKTERDTIRNDVSDNEMVQDFCKQMRDQLPTTMKDIVNKGLNYLRAK